MIFPDSEVRKFFEKVYKTPSCWIRVGFKPKPKGRYTTYRASGFQMPAHRFSYLAVNGDIPHGWQVHHICRNRQCVRPSHLLAVPPPEHVRIHLTDKFVAPKTHCKLGHPLAGANLYTKNTGGKPHKQCRICKLNHNRRWLQAQRSANHWRPKYQPRNLSAIDSKILSGRWHHRKHRKQPLEQTAA